MFSARFMCVLVERPGHSQALLNFTMESSIGNLRIYLCQLTALPELPTKAPRRGYLIWEAGIGRLWNMRKWNYWYTHNFQISKKFKNGLKCVGNAPNSYWVRFYHFADIFHKFPDLNLKQSLTEKIMQKISSKNKFEKINKSGIFSPPMAVIYFQIEK